uniref:Uncharacterized protein n=1 Tax=Solanum lycopersicum TaxID=4081 RepID=A0A3Q7I111_SOLLC
MGRLREGMWGKGKGGKGVGDGVVGVMVGMVKGVRLGVWKGKGVRVGRCGFRRCRGRGGRCWGGLNGSGMGVRGGRGQGLREWGGGKGGEVPSLEGYDWSKGTLFEQRVIFLTTKSLEGLRASQLACMVVLLLNNGNSGGYSEKQPLHPL